jgi:hypothetical protein
MATRLENGVRARVDGGGDGWARAHREALGNRFYLQDVDGFVGYLGFGQNCSNRLFVEYQPDAFEHHERLVRCFAFIALFDRKQSWPAPNENVLTAAVYLSMCRRLGRGQPVPTRFFEVIGPDEGPWTLRELDIETGDEVGRHTLRRDEWTQLWDRLGLTASRRELAAWTTQKLTGGRVP